MLKYEKISLIAADLGCESILPNIVNQDHVPFFKPADGFDKQDMPPHLGEGVLASILPYTIQNNYDRDFRPREYDAVILENDCLRAVFLPTLGGRLWSLYHKKEKRELVYENARLCFGNLALRNAWFAGGVEWNIGIRGHSPLTCDRMFVSFEKAQDGRDILKMYEYEVIRGLVYVMRFALDEDRLCVNITVENTKDTPTYMYWWSNIAFEQKKTTRVVVPTDRSFITAYRDGGYEVSHLMIPVVDGIDTSYPAASVVAKDYFYDIPAERKKWICAFDESGKGLLQYSTRNMQGRKLFVWGHAQGGDHWNKWLTGDRDYMEIQSGLAKTQFEHFPMEGKEIISWNEIYTLGALKEHAPDDDYFAIAAEIDAAVNEDLLACPFFTDPQEVEVVAYGSGRGALRELVVGGAFSTICRFPRESIGAQELYYRDLIEGRQSAEPYAISYTVDEQLIALMESKESKTSLDNYLLGVNLLACNRTAEGVEALLAACTGDHAAVAQMALALYYANVAKDLCKAYEYAADAFDKQSSRAFAIAYCEIAIKAGRFAACADRIATVSGNDEGRLAVYYAQCLCECGRLEEAKALLSTKLLVPDVREGEYSISNIYARVHAKMIERDEGRTGVTDAEALERYPLPRELDFRMH